ncbi:hypothetical protein MLD38_021372 [Melastoma candidum]|uniref:Uncharacterized protein n=1 Tax=Melastoma candidum TaxID=119954 RepID=A0ACB9QFB1_9MYRT|nr:hypothetical protein MLD38_021372 [Melastoma candidum]
MSPKHVLLSVMMAAILAAAIANDVRPRTWKAAVEEPSMVNNDPDVANWVPLEGPHATLHEDKMEGKLANSYESRGPSGSVHYTGLNLDDAPNPAPTPAPAVAETKEGYILEDGKANDQNRCRCKHGPPNGELAKAPAKF